MTRIVIRNYDDLLQSLIKRRHELGMTSLDVDDAAGMASGYCSKCECGAKTYGTESLGKVLDALELDLIAAPRSTDNFTEEPTIKARHYKKIIADRNQKAALRSWSKLDDSARRARIRNARNARWKKGRG